MKPRHHRVGASIATLALLLASCGGSSSDPTTTTAPPTTSAAPATTAADPGTTTPASSTTTAATTAATTQAPTTSEPGGSDDDLVAEGKVIFEETAGGIGCAYCHGLDALGKAELASPDIRGKTFAEIVDALATRAQMTTLVLSDDEIKAVAAYLATLG